MPAMTSQMSSHGRIHKSIRYFLCMSCIWALSLLMARSKISRPLHHYQCVYLCMVNINLLTKMLSSNPGNALVVNVTNPQITLKI